MTTLDDSDDDDDDEGNALFSSFKSSSFPKVNVCVPPGGASTLDVGLPVTTLPQFWSRPDAKAFADGGGVLLLLVVLFTHMEKKKKKKKNACQHQKGIEMCAL